MKKEFIEDNLESVKEMLENVHGDDAIIMVASVNKDGNPMLETIEGKPNMLTDIVCTLLTVALTSIRDDSVADGEVTEGYILEPIMPTAKAVQ